MFNLSFDVAESCWARLSDLLTTTLHRVTFSVDWKSNLWQLCVYWGMDSGRRGTQWFLTSSITSRSWQIVLMGTRRSAGLLAQANKLVSSVTLMFDRRIREGDYKHGGVRGLVG